LIAAGPVKQTALRRRPGSTLARRFDETAHGAKGIGGDQS
jgi:hypothetical protein